MVGVCGVDGVLKGAEMIDALIDVAGLLLVVFVAALAVVAFLLKFGGKKNV